MSVVVQSLASASTARRKQSNITKRYSQRSHAIWQIGTMQDVTHNMAGGRLYLPNNKRPVELSEIEASLTQRRTYKVSTSITASTSLH